MDDISELCSSAAFPHDVSTGRVLSSLDELGVFRSFFGAAGALGVARVDVDSCVPVVNDAARLQTSSTLP